MQKKIDWNYHALRKKISKLKECNTKSFFEVAILERVLEMYVSKEIEILEWEHGSPIIRKKSQKTSAD